MNGLTLLDAGPSGPGGGGPASYEELILADTPSLYWRLGADGLTDLSGNGRNGTAQGGVTVGGAAALLAGGGASTDFDGTDDYISCSYDPFDGAVAFALEVWVSRDTSGTADVIVGAANHPPGCQWSFRNAGPYIDWTDDLGDIRPWGPGSPIPGTGEAAHLVLNHFVTPDEVALYVNGALVSSQANGGTIAANATTLRLGGHVFGSYFDGKMAEFAVYERTLDAAEILAHYEIGANGP